MMVRAALWLRMTYVLHSWVGVTWTERRGARLAFLVGAVEGSASAVVTPLIEVCRTVHVPTFSFDHQPVVTPPTCCTPRLPTQSPPQTPGYQRGTDG